MVNTPLLPAPEYDDSDDYCYNCGHDHPDPSAGSYPAEGCADYVEPV